MFNFQSLRCAGSVLAGVELLYMICKGQFAFDGADAISFAVPLYALAGQVCPVKGIAVPLLENFAFGSTTRQHPETLLQILHLNTQWSAK